MKATIVERFNRTLRNRIHRLTTRNGDGTYLNSLQALVTSYNSRKHHSTGVAPINVTTENTDDMWFRMYESKSKGGKSSPPKLKQGDHVRISKKRTAFERGFTPNWTEKIFVVSSVNKTTTPVTYNIKDMTGTDIKGSFYTQELQRIELPESFAVETILRRQRRRGKLWLFVKWRGYPETFNSWIPESNIV